MSVKVRKKILIVDDEEAIHYIFDRMLEDQYEILHAKNVQEAKAQTFMAKEIDLVITDVFLGGETGIEIVGEIRDFGRNIPVIIMSAYANEMTQQAIQDIQKTFQCVFESKPFDNDEMLGLVRKMLKDD